MHVLHLTRDFPPRHHGGMSSAVGQLAQAQARAGLAVAVLSFDAWRPRAARPGDRAPEPDPTGGLAVLRLTSPDQLDSARAFAAACRPSVLHLHDGILWSAAAALRASRDIPIVLSVHVAHRHMNALRGSDERTLSLAGQELALAAAARVIAPSRSAAEALVAGNASLAARVRVVPHGIDDAAAGLGPRDGPLLAAGRFGDLKGTPELFAALRTMLERRPDIAVTVAGGVPANRRAEARWLRRWREETAAPLQARVRFAGWLDPDALAAHYRTASAVLVPSRYETFGLVALEAMLHGAAVAATAAGGIAELIAHGRNGLLSPPGDAAALAANALRLLDDRELAGRLGRQGALDVRERFSWKRILPRVMDVYREAVR